MSSLRVGRILAVDVGTKRVGVAISDELRSIALPRTPMQARSAVEGIVATVAEDDVSEIVVGWPLEMDGQEGRAVAMVQRFLKRLRPGLQAAGLHVAIETWDERLTTAGAERLLIDAGMSRRRRREVIDSVAAADILSAYMDFSSRGFGDE